jgi:carboxyl-terminal processing protease
MTKFGRKCVLGVATIGLLAGFQAQAASSDTYRQLNLFGDVFERIRRDYVEPVDDKKMIEAAINGMLTSLDPHSSYLDAKDFENMQVQTRGEFGGLGIEVSMESGIVKVISPIDDTPASRAGVKTGDYITHIDKEPVLGLTLNQAVDKMRGAPNTKIELTIVRKGLEKPLFMTLTRDVIKVQSVRFHTEGNTGYVRITSFNEQTDIGLKKAFAEFNRTLGAKMDGIVLDLRNDPGGLLDQAIAVSDDFLDRGEIVQTRGRDGRDVQRYNATKGDLAKGRNIIVLINGGTASASEIVAGALQDHKRAIILGTRSFGKGSVQTIIPLAGNGALRLTTARYYTPSGRSIQAKGIEPDITVEQLKLAGAQAIDPNISEADLKGHLANPDDGAKGAATGETTPAPAATPTAKPSSENTPAKTPAANAAKAAKAANDDKKPGGDDYQLSYALDLLHGLNIAQTKSATN